METAMPMARTVIVPKAGHAAHLERPLEFCNIVANFLTEVASACNAWR
jgi:pimeloyl-ACP methyl ester carboxylesterase